VDSAGVKLRAPYFSVSRLFRQAEQAQAERGRPGPDFHEPLRAALSDSIRHHLIADVPVGIFLSSGLDSSTLTALAAESGNSLHTVTLGFEEFKGTDNDETPLAETVARRYGARHQTIWVTRRDFESDLHRLLSAMDQPTNDGVNSYFISRAASQAGLKVALSGVGGDELFGGYSSFHEIPLAVSRLLPLRPFRPLGSAFRFVSAPLLRRLTSPKYAGLLEYGGSYGGAYLLRRGLFMPWELPQFLDGEMVRQGWDELHTIARLNSTVADIQTPYCKVAALEMAWYLRNQLLRDTDWASMDHSLEVRTPLVDSELLRLTAPMLVSASRPTKQDLAATPSRPLPASVLNRRKTGFVVPVRAWLQQAFDPTSGRERGLRGWVREVYSVFSNNLDNHRAALKRQRPRARPVLAAANAAPGPHLRLLVLLTDAFGGFGGIAKFNRDFLTALCLHERVESVLALPRIMPHPPEVLPAKLVFDTSGLGGKKAFLKAVAAKARALKPAPGAGTPLIICGHINLLPAAMLARRLCGGSVHLIIHGVEAWERSPSLLANACVRHLNGFIAVSNVTKRRFARWTGLHFDQGVVLPNCVDLSAFTPGPKSSALLDRYQLRDRQVLLTFGRLASEERYKGFDEVLQVLPGLLKEMPKLCYLICGDGPDRPRLVAKARNLGLRVSEADSHGVSVLSPQVIFAGRISDAEKADHFRLADVYVMPSSGEGFGIVFLEALACGIPVIGSRADGSVEALLNGRLGQLVDPRDPEDISAAVLRVLKPDGASVPVYDSAGYSVEYFSATRFQQRVHAIVDCIAE
jgi:asparagine synthetase B (glutamine-hydrolysing)/glycosyltransferase involved in cell wall biosynthesis